MGIKGDQLYISVVLLEFYHYWMCTIHSPNVRDRLIKLVLANDFVGNFAYHVW